MLYLLGSNKLPPYLGKGVMLMGFSRIISLLGLLVAVANLAVEVIALVITVKKGKRPLNRPPS